MRNKPWQRSVTKAAAFAQSVTEGTAFLCPRHRTQSKITYLRDAPRQDRTVLALTTMKYARAHFLLSSRHPQPIQFSFDLGSLTTSPVHVLRASPSALASANMPPSRVSANLPPRVTINKSSVPQLSFRAKETTAFEIDGLLYTLKRVQPTGEDEQEAVCEQQNKTFSHVGRSIKRLPRTSATTHRKNLPKDDPRMPPDVCRAKHVKYSPRASRNWRCRWPIWDCQQCSLHCYAG